MAIDEGARHALYRRLEEVLGPEHAATMIGILPPMDWADLATKRDLEAIEARLTGRFDRLHGEIDRRFGEIDRRFGEIDRRFGEMHERQADWARTVIYANLGTVVAIASLAFAAARL